jgi:cytochrome c553
MPDWAYAIPESPPPGSTPPAAAPPDTSPKQVPGSPLTFTRPQISDGFGPADWFPADHPAMPPIVAQGRRPEVRACGLCHYPNGKGRQENADVSGLPVSYFIQTMHDFRDGLRKSAEARKNNTNLMITYAKAMTDDEIKAAAEYFGAMQWTPWIKVVKTGGARTVACGACHGPDLMGMGPVPSIAGRSPSYLARQMYDMQAGARRGEWTELMRPVVARRTDEDFVNITAYVASLTPAH